MQHEQIIKFSTEEINNINTCIIIYCMHAYIYCIYNFIFYAYTN